MIVVMVIFTSIYAWMVYTPMPDASKLVWPYIVWVTYAGIINAAYFLEAN